MWYRTGSVAVANGSAVVTGAGTDFVANAQVGEAFVGPNGRPIEIASIQSATQLTLAQPYTGDSNGGQPYSIQPTSSFARDLALAAGVLLNSFAMVRDGVGQGLFPDGTVAAPGIRFAADQDTGICRVGANLLGLVSGGRLGATLDAAGLLTLNAITLNGDATQRVTRGYANPGYQPARLAMGVAADHVVFEAGATAENNTPGQLAILTKDGGGNLQERVRIDAAGNLGMGTSVPVSYAPFGYGPTVDVRGGRGGSFVTTSGDGAHRGVFAVDGSAGRLNLKTVTATPIVFSVNDVECARYDATGNFLAGVSSGANHIIRKDVPQGTRVLAVYGASTGSPGLIVNSVSGYSPSSADAASFFGHSTSTGRSINAGGTINASGADYAEYVRKSLACGTILKGDVCGIDSNGELTRTWSDARRYVVKSTAPNLVGGDTWAAHLGPRPEAPLYAVPAYDGPAEPTKPVEPAAFVPPLIEMPVQPVRADGEEDEAYLLRLAAFLNDRVATIAQAQAAADAQIEAAKAQVAYTAAVGQYQADLAAYREAQAAYRTAVDAAEAAHAVALAAHGEALTAWGAELEAARQTVDRIAFSGQVPVNVDAETLAACEAALADGVAVYLVAVARGAGIDVSAVREADMTLQQYMRRLGAVWAIRDGRPWIDVQHG